ncbi:purine-nucleoside phosphorylase [Helicobacter cappadocius]|uniref:Purine-nucleoside phosphorylase n=1 Tax=Helicobacter cappadocius TaxID=3063998 RepID=A0AA90PQR5_9HELI|nr:MULTISPECIES: purine-nucleoside phosphorylase [unclassified Helicobacter]MDO7252510.1 purine-nucleoside phosphorylase [Helicobacter sp. faydin-H75]MDP2538377.1 purine-nucleoside phosphorylase [Helicobacter sp. faydin-H76]
MFVCAGKVESFSFAKSIGIGMIESAINLTRICSREIVGEIIFIGSAGSYSYDIQPFEICLSTKATQIEMSYINTDTYTPIDNQIEMEFENVPRGTKNMIVNSSNYINTNLELSKKMVYAGIMLENMEFFSVLKVAQNFGIKSYGIFCVTNYCNDNAHKDFVQNHQKAKETIEEFIRNNYTL